MKKFLLLLLAVACGPAHAALVSWNFTGENALPVSAPPGLAASALRTENSWGTVVNPFPSSSPGNYPDASGGTNFGSAVKTGPFSLESSTYFTFTLTPDFEVGFILDSIEFGTRSTMTGPQAFSLRWDRDGFAGSLAEGELHNDSAWSFQSAALPEFAASDGLPVEFRLYVHGGQGTAVSGVINHRLDDLAIGVSVYAIPEPSTVVFGFSAAGFLIAGCLTRKYGHWNITYKQHEGHEDKNHHALHVSW